MDGTAPSGSLAQAAAVLRAQVMVGGAALAILSVGLGPALAELSLPLGLRLAPWDAALQQQAAHAAFAAAQPDPALEHARKALSLMPLDQPSLTIAALRLEPRRATAALNQAAALGWRDPATNILLYRAALREHAPDVAATRIDALGRVAGAVVTGPLADNLLAYPGGLKALAERAAHHLGSGWIPRYLSSPPKTAEAIRLRSDFVASIDADDGEWLREAVREAGGGFAQAGYPEAGVSLWRRTLARKRLFAGPVYDPELRTFGEAAAIGGDWALAENAPADVARAERGGITISALGTSQGQVLSQAILPQRRVDLTVGWAGPRDAVLAYAWSLGCAGGGVIPLVQTLAPASVGTGSAWTARIAAATPPGCKLGWLTLTQTQRLAEGTSVTLLRVTPARQP